MVSLLEKLSQTYSSGEQDRRPATPRQVAQAIGREPMELIDGVAQYPVTEGDIRAKGEGYQRREGKRKCL